MSQPPDLRAMIAGLELTQTGTARLIGVPPRTMRRWIADPACVPGPVWRLLSLLAVPANKNRLARFNNDQQPAPANPAPK